MESKIAEAIKLKFNAVAVILTYKKPDEAIQFKERGWGCVANMMLAATKGKTAVFDRNTYGCPGGGTGLGFGNRYGSFPIQGLLAEGFDEYVDESGKTMPAREGEFYYKTSELARQWVDSMPMTDVPAKYVVFKPLNETQSDENISQIIFFVNPDQLSALLVLANYGRGVFDAVSAPFCAGCQSLLFGYEGQNSDTTKAVIGFFDITVRRYVDRDILTFTMPYKLFIEMENNTAGSFLKKNHYWQQLLERN